MYQKNWIKENSFHHSQFADYDKLISLKKKQNLRISLCIPCLNEEKTIGNILDTLLPKLNHEYPLLDEVLVIDSGSTDRTEREVIRRNVPFYHSKDILPEFGDFAGKGENLWKSLFVSSGDIILWLDADIRNIHPRFVYGLIGPLLQSRKIQFVKACYRRPLQIGEKMEQSGGGRVTEILVKPFFNLLFPELAVINQPLSGEYAGRRQLLERVPFFTGYAVESALLIDIDRYFGHECIAQVNLDIRIHRNQSLDKLRRMAFGILRILLKRAEEQGKLVMFQHLTSSFIKNLRPDRARSVLENEEVKEIERPPMMQISGYQRKRRLRSDDIILHKLRKTPDRMAHISLSALLEEKFIILDGKGSEKREIFKEISSCLFSNNTVHSQRDLYHDLLQREKLLSTGIGRGIAIPHCVSKNVIRFSIAIYRPISEVGFQAIDGKPVQLFFFVIAPPSGQRLYLKVLGKLSNIMRDTQSLPKLMEANDAMTFISILKKIEFMKQVVAELRDGTHPDLMHSQH